MKTLKQTEKITLLWLVLIVVSFLYLSEKQSAKRWSKMCYASETFFRPPAPTELSFDMDAGLERAQSRFDRRRLFDNAIETKTLTQSELETIYRFRLMKESYRKLSLECGPMAESSRVLLEDFFSDIIILTKKLEYLSQRLENKSIESE